MARKVGGQGWWPALMETRRLWGTEERERGRGSPPPGTSGEDKEGPPSGSSGEDREKAERTRRLAVMEKTGRAHHLAALGKTGMDHHLAALGKTVRGQLVPQQVRRGPAGSGKNIEPPADSGTGGRNHANSSEGVGPPAGWKEEWGAPSARTKMSDLR